MGKEGMVAETCARAHYTHTHAHVCAYIYIQVVPRAVEVGRMSRSIEPFDDLRLPACILRLIDDF